MPEITNSISAMFCQNMKKMIFVLVYSIAALSIFSYGKAAENEQLAYCTQWTICQ